MRWNILLLITILSIQPIFAEENAGADYFMKRERALSAGSISEAKAAVQLYEQRVKEAHLDVEKGKIFVNYTQQDLRRQANLYSKDATSLEEYEQTQEKADLAKVQYKVFLNKVKQAEAELAMAKARLEIAESIAKEMNF